jgi:hypothetical protein
VQRSLFSGRERGPVKPALSKVRNPSHPVGTDRIGHRELNTQANPDNPQDRRGFRILIPLLAGQFLQVAALSAALSAALFRPFCFSP